MLIGNALRATTRYACEVDTKLTTQEYMPCRKLERPLNKCVLEQLVCAVNLTNPQNLVKKIPGSPEGQPQIHEKTNPVISRLQK